MAWLGGYGTTLTDRLSQQVALPASANAISLTFFMHIDTEEQSATAFDKLRVRVRNANGQLLETLKTVSNLNAAPGYILHSLDLTQFKERPSGSSSKSPRTTGRSHPSCSTISPWWWRPPDDVLVLLLYDDPLMVPQLRTGTAVQVRRMPSSMMRNGSSHRNRMERHPCPDTARRLRRRWRR